MADRSVHYEAAFEAYLRQLGRPYVAVDEAKKALFADARLKSFDFVVYSQGKPNLLVDVKGRSAKSRSGAGRSNFETWTTQGDVDDLIQWQQVFGEGFCAVLVFVYWIETPLALDPDVFEHAGRSYRLYGVGLEDYRQHMRRRSAKWETVALPASDFRSLAKPMSEWL